MTTTLTGLSADRTTSLTWSTLVHAPLTAVDHPGT